MANELVIKIGLCQKFKEEVNGVKFVPVIYILWSNLPTFPIYWKSLGKYEILLKG